MGKSARIVPLNAHGNVFKDSGLACLVHLHHTSMCAADVLVYGRKDDDVRNCREGSRRRKVRAARPTSGTHEARCLRPLKAQLCPPKAGAVTGAVSLDLGQRPAKAECG